MICTRSEAVFRYHEAKSLPILQLMIRAAVHDEIVEIDHERVVVRVEIRHVETQFVDGIREFLLALLHDAIPVFLDVLGDYRALDS